MLDAFFDGQAQSREIFDALRREIDAIGPSDIRVQKSQISFRRQKGFCWVWIPERYLRRKLAPLVLTFSFRHRDPSARWKQIVEPVPDRFTHHLELNSSADIDAEVVKWLQEAYNETGSS